MSSKEQTSIKMQQNMNILKCAFLTQIAMTSQLANRNVYNLQQNINSLIFRTKEEDELLRLLI